MINYYRNEEVRTVMKPSFLLKKAPAAIGPYSQGIQAGNLIITSGQLPIDPATGAFPATIEEQPSVPRKLQGSSRSGRCSHGKRYQDDRFPQRTTSQP